MMAPVRWKLFSKCPHLNALLNSVANDICFLQQTLSAIFVVYECLWSLAYSPTNLNPPNNWFLKSTYILFIPLVGWRRGCPVSWHSGWTPCSWGRDASRYRGHWKSTTGHSGPSRGENASSRWWGRRNGTPTAPRRNRSHTDEEQVMRAGKTLIL